MITHLDRSQSVKETEAQINELAQELYATSNRCFQPCYPWVFVRVLDREQRTKGGLILPAIDQNKTVIEGIVLATWKPFVKETGFVYSNGVQRSKLTQMKSDLVPGDHALFPHWAGLPIDGFSAKHYRIVKEDAWKKDQDGGIFATIDHEDTDTKPISVLRDLIDETITAVGSGDNWPTWSNVASLLAAKIEDKFLLIDRDGQSVTLSGR